jgi:uncharacterized Zn finger protein
MSSLSSLTKTDVRNWTEQRFYDRGENYVRQGRIQRPRRSNALLKAECQGSRPSPYHVEAELDTEGIAWAECSCPMGGGGYCKHVVALLLTWVQSPKDFTETPSLDETLQDCSKETLVTLIQKMVGRHPDLEQLVSIAATPRDASVDEDEMRAQIQSVFDQVGYNSDPYYAPIEVAEDLEPFFNLADDYAERNQLADATTIYRLLIEETRDHYLDFNDEEGELATVITESTDSLSTLLADVDDEALREPILNCLLDVYLWDLDLGGYGIGDWAYDALIDHTTPDEKHRLADAVRDHLPDASSNGDRDPDRVFVLSGSGGSWSSDWKRESLGGFLLDLIGDTLDDDAYLRLCRRTDRLTDLVDRLLQRDRRDEALAAARSASDYDLYRLASTFSWHNADEAFHDLVLDRLDDDPDRRLVEWARDYAEEHDHPDRALDLSRRLFWARKSESTYQRLRADAQAVGTWDTVQSDVLDRLRENGDYALLTRLHLSDGDVQAALQTVDKVGSSPWQYGGASLRMNVADAAEETHPDEAIRLYTDRARSLIEQRGRSNYADAGDLLARVKTLYDRMDDLDAWQSFFDALYDDELHRLPAAQDEFEKRDLL